MQQVHLRINDAATGKPTPVRLRITDADGRYYAPYGRLTEFATGVNQDVGGNVQLGAKKWAYIDGTCEILLPPGKLHIEVTKGPEYKPIDEEVTLLAGKMSLRFTIERWYDSRKYGWYSGDTRVHFLSPDAALLEGQAEDLAVVNLLAKETTITDQFGKKQKSIPNILSFSGQSFARESPSCGVAVNTHNVHPQLGSLGLLHCHRIVYPLAFDDTSWTLDDWCGQCHRKKGLVVWADPQHQTADFACGEPLAELILGNVDAFELTFFENSPFDALADYYKLLNAGIVVPLVGASGKANNGVAIGAMRTYVSFPSGREYFYSNWIEFVRAGRTYVTNEPVMNFEIDNAYPQTPIQLADSVALPIRTAAASTVRFDRLELIWNGEVIASAKPLLSNVCTAVIEHEFQPEGSGWLAARCFGETLVPGWPAPQRIFAHTSPFLVCHPDRPKWHKPEVVQSIWGDLEDLALWAQKVQHVRLHHIVEQARTVLAKKLS